MTRFRRSPQLSKLAPADARWLRGVLSETFPDGIPHSPFAVLDRLAARLEHASCTEEQEWLRAELLQEIYRSLNRHVDALAIGEQAYQLRPWDPRSTYSLALTYQALTYGAAESTFLTQSLGGLPLHRSEGRDAQSVEHALALLDLTEEQAALRTLSLLQATLSLGLNGTDRKRVERTLAHLTEEWPELRRPLAAKPHVSVLSGARSGIVEPIQTASGTIRSTVPSAFAFVGTFGDHMRSSLRRPQSLSVGEIGQSIRRLPIHKWKYGGAAAIVAVLLVAMLGTGIVLTSNHSSGPVGPTAASAAEDPTTDLFVFDQEGNAMGNPMNVYRESPTTIIIALINHTDNARRYELSVRIDDEEWPLGTAEVQPNLRWDAGFQITLSETPKRGLEIIAQDAGTLALAKSARFGVSLREAPVAVRATPDLSPTVSASVTPQATVVPPRTLSPLGPAQLSQETRPVIVPQASVNVPVAAPTQTTNTAVQRTATAPPVPTLPAQLPSTIGAPAAPTTTGTTTQTLGSGTPVAAPTGLAGGAATPTTTTTVAPYDQFSVPPTATPTPRPNSFVGSTPTVAAPTAAAPTVVPPTSTPTPLPPSPFYTPTPTPGPVLGLPTPYPPIFVNR